MVTYNNLACESGEPMRVRELMTEKSEIVQRGHGSRDGHLASSADPTGSRSWRC
jgi:hypothetical protein